MCGNGRNLEDEFNKLIQLYQVNVVLWEGRHLVLKNVNYKVVVSIGKEKKRIYSKCNETDCAYFNDFCIFLFKLSLNVLLDKILTVKVYQKSTKKLIGSFNVELATVWSQPNHQFYHKWAVLMDPKSPAGEVRGFIKCDIIILLKGMTVKRGLECDGYLEDNLLVPYGGLKNRLRTRLILSVFRADSFSPSLSGRFKLIQPYIKITYGGKVKKTSIARDKHAPVWNEELIFLDLFPPLMQNLFIEICDIQSSQESLGNTTIDIRNLYEDGKNGFLPTFGPNFLYLYEPMRKFERHKNSSPADNSFTYAARLLLSLRTEVIEKYDTEILTKTKSDIGPTDIQPIIENMYFEYNNFILFAAIFDALLFDAKQKKIKIRLVMGPKKCMEKLKIRGKKKERKTSTHLKKKKPLRVSKTQTKSESSLRKKHKGLKKKKKVCFRKKKRRPRKKTTESATDTEYEIVFDKKRKTRRKKKESCRKKKKKVPRKKRIKSTTETESGSSLREERKIHEKRELCKQKKEKVRNERIDTGTQTLSEEEKDYDRRKHSKKRKKSRPTEEIIITETETFSEEDCDKRKHSRKRKKSRPREEIIVGAVYETQLEKEEDCDKKKHSEKKTKSQPKEEIIIETESATFSEREEDCDKIKHSRQRKNPWPRQEIIVGAVYETVLDKDKDFAKSKFSEIKKISQPKEEEILKTKSEKLLEEKDYDKRKYSDKTKISKPKEEEIVKTKKETISEEKDYDKKKLSEKKEISKTKEEEIVKTKKETISEEKEKDYDKKKHSKKTKKSRPRKKVIIETVSEEEEEEEEEEDCDKRKHSKKRKKKSRPKKEIIIETESETFSEREEDYDKRKHSKKRKKSRPREEIIIKTLSEEEDEEKDYEKRIYSEKRKKSRPKEEIIIETESEIIVEKENDCKNRKPSRKKRKKKKVRLKKEVEIEPDIPLRDERRSRRESCERKHEKVPRKRGIETTTETEPEITLDKCLEEGPHEKGIQTHSEMTTQTVIENQSQTETEPWFPLEKTKKEAIKIIKKIFSNKKEVSDTKSETKKKEKKERLDILEKDTQTVSEMHVQTDFFDPCLEKKTEKTKTKYKTETETKSETASETKSETTSETKSETSSKTKPKTTSKRKCSKKKHRKHSKKKTPKKKIVSKKKKKKRKKKKKKRKKKGKKCLKKKIKKETNTDHKARVPKKYHKATITAKDKATETTKAHVRCEKEKPLPKPHLEKKPLPPVQKEVPRPICPEIPKPICTDPRPICTEIPKPICPEIPKPICPEIPKPICPEVPKPICPEISKPICPEIPKPICPEIPKPICPEIPRPICPEIPRPICPEIPKPICPERKNPKPKCLERRDPIPKPKHPRKRKPALKTEFYCRERHPKRTHKKSGRQAIRQIKVIACADKTPTETCTVKKGYSYVKFHGNFPCISIFGEWPNSLRRMYCCNVIKKAVQDWTNEINKIKDDLQSEPCLEFPQKLNATLANLYESCEYILFLTRVINLDETELCRERRRYYDQEIADIAQKIKRAFTQRPLKPEEELNKIDTYLAKLTKYAQDPENSFPNTEIWLLSGNRTLAQHRIKTEDVAYSDDFNYRGIMCGKTQTIICRGKKGKIKAKLEILIWFGLAEDFEECLKILPDGLNQTHVLYTPLPGINVPYRLVVNEKHDFLCKMYIFQGKIFFGFNNSGKANAFVRIIFRGQNRLSKVRAKTLNPVWDETLIFSHVTLYGPIDYIKENPPCITVEVLDRKKRNKTKLIGRSFIAPLINFIEDGDAPPPKLKWVSVMSEFREVGQILMAAELFEFSSDMTIPHYPVSARVPESIRPHNVKYTLEIYFWGVRPLIKIRSVKNKVFVTLECGESLVKSPILHNVRHKLNFPSEIIDTELNLPEELEYAPPINVKLFHIGSITHTSSYVATCLVPSIRYILQPRVPCACLYEDDEEECDEEEVEEKKEEENIICVPNQDIEEGRKLPNTEKKKNFFHRLYEKGKNKKWLKTREEKIKHKVKQCREKKNWLSLLSLEYCESCECCESKNAKKFGILDKLAPSKLKKHIHNPFHKSNCNMRDTCIQCCELDFVICDPPEPDPCESSSEPDPCESSYEPDPCESSSEPDPCESSSESDPCESSSESDPCESSSESDSCESSSESDSCESSPEPEPCAPPPKPKPCKPPPKCNPCVPPPPKCNPCVPPPPKCNPCVPPPPKCKPCVPPPPKCKPCVPPPPKCNPCVPPPPKCKPCVPPPPKCNPCVPPPPKCKPCVPPPPKCNPCVPPPEPKPCKPPPKCNPCVPPPPKCKPCVPPPEPKPCKPPPKCKPCEPPPEPKPCEPPPKPKPCKPPPEPKPCKPPPEPKPCEPPPKPEPCKPPPKPKPCKPPPEPKPCEPPPKPEPCKPPPKPKPCKPPPEPKPCEPPPEPKPCEPPPKPKPCKPPPKCKPCEPPPEPKPCEPPPKPEPCEPPPEPDPCSPSISLQPCSIKFCEPIEECMPPFEPPPPVCSTFHNPNISYICDLRDRGKEPVLDELCWWTRYRSSEVCRIESRKFPRIKIFKEELEAQPEFNGFQDFLKNYLMVTENVKGNKKGIAVAKVKIALKFQKHTETPEEEKGLLLTSFSNQPLKFIVRIYVVCGKNLAARDISGKSSPYLYLQLGKNIINDRKHCASQQLNPIFGRSFEFQGVFPQDYLLTIKVFDRYSRSDGLIGETTIDLENRFYSKFHATCGIASSYIRYGAAKWRDIYFPSEILQMLCNQLNFDEPIYEDNEVVIEGYVFKTPVSNDDEDKIEIQSLMVLNNWHSMPVYGFHLVPEHVETRSLYHPSLQGIEQGKLLLWVDIFPADLANMPPKVDITPQPPVAMELRAIVWNVVDVMLDDKSLHINDRISDIYVKGWILFLEEDIQKTDIHYRSTNAEGNFNWRFIFHFNYIPVERRMAIHRKVNVCDLCPEERRVQCKLEIQVWDSDAFGDDFLGTLILELCCMPKGAKLPSRCTLKMLAPNAGTINLFKIKRTRGWWPFRRLKMKETLDNEFELSGKIDLELEILTEEEAKKCPAGLGRNEPQPLPLPNRHFRPVHSTSKILSPVKVIPFLSETKSMISKVKHFISKRKNYIYTVFGIVFAVMFFIISFSHFTNLSVPFIPS